MSETTEIQNQFGELQKRYQQHLPKVDPKLVSDVLLRQTENPQVVPMYLVEVFTKSGLDTEQVRKYIISKTGMSPAIYDDGTHYVTNQKLTLDMLKEISDSEDVIEVTGEYTGGVGGYGASHEHRHDRFEEEKRVALAKAAASEPEKPVERKTGYGLVALTAGGIIGAIALAGFIISGGLLPNSNSPAIASGTEPGVLLGSVTGPGGLPAVGAMVIAAEQGSGFTENAFVSVNGQYYFDLPPGSYIVMAAFPDGTNKVVNLEVARGSSHDLDFSY